jgi:hypothetical protein
VGEDYKTEQRMYRSFSELSNVILPNFLLLVNFLINRGWLIVAGFSEGVPADWFFVEVL